MNFRFLNHERCIQEQRSARKIFPDVSTAGEIICRVGKEGALRAEALYELDVESKTWSERIARNPVFKNPAFALPQRMVNRDRMGQMTLCGANIRS